MAGNTKSKHVAVIGTGPSGLSAVKALDDEKAFDVIRVFERRDRIGGTWIYDPEPSPFTVSPTNPTPKTPLPQAAPQIPTQLPAFTSPAPEDLTQRTGLYSYLDSNVGAAAMEFTYASIPKINSALSVRRFGFSNPTRPYRVVADYLADIFAKYLHLVTFNTTIERVTKNSETGKWDLVLRKSGVLWKGVVRDHWWKEEFDAVVIATGHYNIPHIPAIPGIEEFHKAFPDRLEHSKQFRDRDAYTGKNVVVVGGSVSASDFVLDTYQSVRAPLIVAQRGLNANPALDNVWKLPGVVQKPTVERLKTENGGTVEFSDGTWVEGVDKIVFATGYRLSYPFLQPNPVTDRNRLAGFYQHVWNIEDPSLIVIGQVRAALSFRNYEYQAVAAARVLAGRGKLPSIAEQKQWEEEKLAVRGPTHQFHTIAPDFKEYFDGLRAIAGPPAKESEAYDLPAWDDAWAVKGFAVLDLKDKFVRRLEGRREGSGLEDEGRLLAKL